MRRVRSLLRGTIVALTLAGCASCASFDPPRPWEKGTLARPEIRFDGDPLGERNAQHVYSSREAVGGGYGVGGGGCGCN